MSESKIDNTFNVAMDQINKLEKTFTANGRLEKAISEVGGDISWLKDIQESLSSVYESLEAGHYGAVAHLDNVDEQLSKKKKITNKTPVGMVAEGVLDADDDDGFMARSQLYFLARDAIKLHGIIDDRDDLEPWVQSKIAQASKDIDAVSRYTEYNAMKAEVEPEGIKPHMHSHAEVPPHMEEGYSILPPMDTDKYQERDGLEGPFPTKSGKVVYYDPKEGSYYDSDTDIYLSYDDFRALDKDVNEGQMKNMLHDNAEDMDKEDFVREYADQLGGGEAAADFWDNVNGVEEDSSVAKVSSKRKEEHDAMVVTPADRELNTPAWQRYKAGDPRYKYKAHADSDITEGMEFDEKRTDDLQMVAKDLFKNALSKAKKKVK